MFTHEQIWRGIDLMAAHAQTSPSGLARRAGLDATTFNPSKRTSADGSKPRWPSTESLSKAMRAAGLDFAAFAALVSGRPETKGLRTTDLAERTPPPRFGLDGLPRRTGDLPLPVFDPVRHVAVRVSGDRMAPVYRDGELLILDRTSDAVSGNRVLVELHSGEIGAFELREIRVQTVRLKALVPGQPDRSLSLGEIRTLQTIAWASQSLHA